MTGMKRQMRKIQLTQKNRRKFKQGYPLIQREDLVNPKDMAYVGEWLTFVTPQGDYLGDGYLGVQNKGSGWLINHQANLTLDEDFFADKFMQAFERRNHFFNDDLTTAFRLFNGEGDGVGGVTIDLYHEFALFTWYNASIYEQRELIMTAFRSVSPFVKGIYEKNRFEGKGIVESQHVSGLTSPTPLIVQENGVNFATYLDDGMMTGIFLDQKHVRGRLVEGLALGKSVLNTFSYTGAFSVAAAMGGAASTVSVDLAKRSLPKTKEMFEVNQLPLETNKIVVMDVFEYINYARRKAFEFDVVILDPPSFARNKKRTFSVAQNYGDLVEEVVTLLAPKGTLIASTNAANVSYDKYQSMVEGALKKSGRRFKLVDQQRLPADFALDKNFPAGNYLKVLIYEVI